jgi:hypothetical protein
MRTKSAPKQTLRALFQIELEQLVQRMTAGQWFWL